MGDKKINTVQNKSVCAVFFYVRPAAHIILLTIKKYHSSLELIVCPKILVRY